VISGRKESLLLNTESSKGIICCGINYSLRVNSFRGLAYGFLQSMDSLECRFKCKAVD
jgi:hypothetical protein